MKIASVTVITNLPESSDRVRLKTFLPSPWPEDDEPVLLEFQAPQHEGLDYARKHLVPLMAEPKLEVIDSALGERKEVRP